MKRCFSCFSEYDDEFEICPFCGHVSSGAPSEPVYLYPGTVLHERYTIGTVLNAGGFGIVYKAWDAKLDSVIAIKEFYVGRLMMRATGIKEIIINKKNREEFEYRKKRFLAEARTMAAFGSHRNIPNVFDYFEENNTAYIVMEYLPGMDLKKYLEQNGGNIDMDFALMIVNEVGNALKSLHDKGIIHGDVSPDNIFICNEKEIRILLMDLGNAKLADGTDNVVDIVVKPGYSPREQYEEKSTIGPWTDIYALGATLYMMLTGEKPDESTNRTPEDTLIPPSALNPDIPENLNNTILKAMAVQRQMRFRSIPDFLKAINGEKKVITLAKEKRQKRFRRTSGIAAAVILIIFASVLIAHVAASRQRQEELKPASISVWFPVSDSSSRESAISSVINDFAEKYPDVSIEYRAIPESEYIYELTKANSEGKLPNLFESTGVSLSLLDNAADVSSVLRSRQAKECLFLNQYDNYYSSRKKVPLAVEVPIAYVITSGSTDIQYDSNYFSSLSDFGNAPVSADERYSELLSLNFDITGLKERPDFISENNTSPVLLSSTMSINDVRKLPFEKKFVYYNASKIYCKYTFEWSIGQGFEEETRAAQLLLSWMLGNVYQRMLMVNSSGSEQIPELPINKECFETKISLLSNLNPISGIYKRFVFKREW